MAATTFTNTSGGTWDVAGNWSSDTVPGSSDDAFINNPGTYTVTLDDTEGPNSIVLNDADATLHVTADGVVLANSITLDAGTLWLSGDIIGSTITSAGAAFAPDYDVSGGGTLDGVTWMGPLIGAPGGAFYAMSIKDGITLLNSAGTGPGTLDIASNYMVNILDATTLDDMTIRFDAFNSEYLNGSFSEDLNLGANVVVTQSIASSLGEIGGLQLNNLGTIDLSASHGSFLVQTSTFDNAGTLIVTGGETAAASGNFSNTGVVSVNANSVLTIENTTTSSNDTTISVANASSLIVSGNLGGSGEITLVKHAVAELHNISGSVLFEDNLGTLDLLAPSTFTGAIGGFEKGDTIDLVGQPATSPPLYSSTTGILTINNGPTVVAMLNVGLNYAHETFTLGHDGAGTGTDVTVACYAAGTRILTTTGEVAVEALRVGDLLPALLGRQLARVRWIGHRRIDCRRHPTPSEVWPVRVQAGAFGDALPHRDLWLSPDHAVLHDNALIPIRYLVNGATIAQVETDAVTYWHLELDRHEVVLAEGLPAESFLDTGNRAAFEHAGAVVHAHPDFALLVWEKASCAPLLVSGPALAAAREKLLRRASTLGFAHTTDADLRLIVDGHTVRPDLDGSTFRFALPDGARDIRLASRSVRPASVFADGTDHRRLGVAVAALLVDGEAVPAGDPRRASGWHAADAHWQWTDGDAGLAIAGARRVEVTLLSFLPYWNTATTGAKLAAR